MGFEKFLQQKKIVRGDRTLGKKSRENEIFTIGRVGNRVAGLGQGTRPRPRPRPRLEIDETETETETRPFLPCIVNFKLFLMFWCSKSMIFDVFACFFDESRLHGQFLT